MAAEKGSGPEAEAASEIPLPGHAAAAELRRSHGTTMGIHFGNLARVRHIITYSLSPFEQRAIPNIFSDALPNVWRRFSSQVFKVAPPFLGAYLLYSWGTQEFERLKRKNPADYENDQ